MPTRLAEAMEANEDYRSFRAKLEKEIKFPILEGKSIGKRKVFLEYDLRNNEPICNSEAIENSNNNYAIRYIRWKG